LKVFIVYAHHEPKSFNAALLDRSVRTLTSLGHEVKVSDLYAMNFNPLATAADFGKRRFPDILQYDREQKFNSEFGSYAPDIQAEIDKTLWCDFLILQFPLWWFSVPAVMKGWLERCWVNGVVQGKGRRMDTGGLKGRRAMLSISTGAYAVMAEPDGLLGALDVNLWHLHNGTLAYAGFEVLPPFMSWSIHYTSLEERHTYLDAYEQRMRTLETTKPMFFHPLADFGPDWRLKPEITPNTAAHSRPIKAST